MTVDNLNNLNSIGKIFVKTFGGTYEANQYRMKATSRGLNMTVIPPYSIMDHRFAMMCSCSEHLAFTCYFKTAEGVENYLKTKQSLIYQKCLKQIKADYEDLLFDADDYESDFEVLSDLEMDEDAMAILLEAFVAEYEKLLQIVEDM